jgi:hypothetical protein
MIYDVACDEHDLQLCVTQEWGFLWTSHNACFQVIIEMYILVPQYVRNMSNIIGKTVILLINAILFLKSQVFWDVMPCNWVVPTHSPTQHDRVVPTHTASPSDSHSLTDTASLSGLLSLTDTVSPSGSHLLTDTESSVVSTHWNSITECLPHNNWHSATPKKTWILSNTNGRTTHLANCFGWK